MELTGAGKIVYTVNENASLVANPIRGGIGMIQGPTLRGERSKAVFIANWTAFRREFGGFHPSSPFPTYMKVMLDAGGKFWVSRVVHYTDIEDRATVQGTKATGNLTVDNGVDPDDVFTIAAKEVGTGYNGVKLTIQEAASRIAGNFDLLIALPDFDEVQTVSDIPTNPTADQITALNLKLKHIQIVSIVGPVSAGEITLAGGAEVVADIDANDYVGSQLSTTGLYSFGKATDAFRLINWKADPVIDVSYALFARNTMRVKAELGSPIGANAIGMEEYRMGEGVYTHTPVNDWLATFNNGDLVIPDPQDLTRDITIPGVVAVIANKLKKDATGRPWLSAATLPEFGIIRTANRGVPFDLNAAENVADYDRLSGMGINAVSNDETFGSVYHGNDSALLNRTSILKHENVADLMLFIFKSLPQYIKTQQWRPNDPEMWERLYLNVRPFITGTLVAGRAIRPQENRDWFWIGDQDVDDYQDAVFNSIAAIDNGQYKARFVFIPIAATKYIGIDFVPTDSNSIAAVVRDDLNV